MPRSNFAFVAAVIAALLAVLGTASCTRHRSAPVPVEAVPPSPAMQACPDGTVILASDACPGPPPPPPPPPPMANGGDDHPPMANGGGDYPPPLPPPPQSAERNGGDHEGHRRGDRAEYAGWRDGPDFAAAGPDEPTPAMPATGAAPGDGVEKGFGAFRPLDDMEVDNWYPVEFFAARDKKGLEEEAEGRALTAPTGIYVGPWMRVTLLKDPNFEILAKSNAVQPTGRDRRASWQWDVRPLTGGERMLYATVEVLSRNADGSFETLETRTRRVGVKVKIGTWRGFLIALQNAATFGEALSTLFAAWQKTLVTLAALIGALGGVVVAVRKLRKPARGGRRRRRG